MRVTKENEDGREVHTCRALRFCPDIISDLLDNVDDFMVKRSWEFQERFITRNNLNTTAVTEKDPEDRDKKRNRNKEKKRKALARISRVGTDSFLHLFIPSSTEVGPRRV